MSKHHLIFAKDKPDEKQKRKYKTRQLWCFLHEIFKSFTCLVLTNVACTSHSPSPVSLFCAGEEIFFLIFLFNTSCSSHLM